MRLCEVRSLRIAKLFNKTPSRDINMSIADAKITNDKSIACVLFDLIYFVCFETALFKSVSTGFTPEFESKIRIRAD